MDKNFERFHRENFLDENKRYIFMYAYDEESQTLIGGLQKNPMAFHDDDRVEDSLHNMMELTCNGKPVELKKSDSKDSFFFNTFEMKVNPEEKLNLDLNLRGMNFSSLEFDAEKGMDLDEHHNLSAFEVRMMGRTDDVIEIPYDRSKVDDIKPPLTDLHTHFPAIATADDLIDLALNKPEDKGPVFYPTAFLDEMKVPYPKGNVVHGKKGDVIPLTKELFSDHSLDIIARHLEIPSDKQATFTDLEQIYKYRSPITKDKDLFVPMLRKIAQDYKRQGVKYAEMSFSGRLITSPEILREVHKELPKIEKETGVQLRFMAAMKRSAYEPENRHRIDRIKEVAKSPYIVGIDYMGHETNSTKEFAHQLDELAQWAKENDPNFVLRVHAGENSSFKDNVKDALKIAKKHGVKMRIGHGIYGIDRETKDLFKETGAIVEFNMHSNLALNNIDGVEQLPIKEYQQEGIDVVLGQDGGGIYQTTAIQEAMVARFAGVTPEGMKAIRRTEMRYIAEQQANFKAKASKEGAFDVENVYISEDYKKEVKNLSKKKQQEYKKEQDKIEAAGMNVNDEEMNQAVDGKRPIFISGSGTSFSNISDADKEEIQIALKLLVKSIDPEKAYFITSGYSHGVEKEFHKIMKEENAEHTVVAAMAMDTSAESVSSEGVTYGTFIGSNRYDRSAKIIDKMSNMEGEAVFIGGGNITNDQIQMSANADLSYHLMDGPDGAATNKATYDSKHSFSGAIGLIESLYESSFDVFKKDFDIQLLPAYHKEEWKNMDGPPPQSEVGRRPPKQEAPKEVPEETAEMPQSNPANLEHILPSSEQKKLAIYNRMREYKIRKRHAAKKTRNAGQENTAANPIRLKNIRNRKDGR